VIGAQASHTRPRRDIQNLTEHVPSRRIFGRGDEGRPRRARCQRRETPGAGLVVDQRRPAPTREVELQPAPQEEAAKQHEQQEGGCDQDLPAFFNTGRPPNGARGLVDVVWARVWGMSVASFRVDPAPPSPAVVVWRGFSRRVARRANAPPSAHQQAGRPRIQATNGFQRTRAPIHKRSPPFGPVHRARRNSSRAACGRSARHRLGGRAMNAEDALFGVHQALDRDVPAASRASDQPLQLLLAFPS